MLQKQSLLRVDEFGVNRRYVEEQRIEFVYSGDEAAPLAVVVSASSAVFTEVFAPIPALFGNLRDAVLSLAQIVPVGVDIDCLGIPATQSDDGDRISIQCRTGHSTPQTTE